jgi:hypothetical protein
LARDSSTNFTVAEEIAIDNQLLLPELINLAEKQNPLLQAQIINKRVSELQLKQVKGSLSYDSCQHRLQLRSKPIKFRIHNAVHIKRFELWI